MQGFLDAAMAEFLGTPHVPLSIMLPRIIGSVILTGLIGFERETRDRPAGLRTHMLVGLAAACYCITALDLIARGYEADVSLDPLRLVNAVTGGVAFLAAGLIVFARGEIRGLTTGASLWLAASVGLAVGLGQWILALSVTALSLFIVRVLGAAEARMKSKGD
ncbi:MgtC/SapB family protein [Defluviimonas sp. WL0002]|uniref:Protein MgtC n=1 Tax=Albidovulum marisflavi TaxID=2984159 RepID=A0ABT2ZD73_9RHOB|nr:MgtC/SapB family protein [Defluviimonas sp. WL0002]MCV2869093.1 MgtC/SapB family protein [Defluviimonas sp. WL0002]